MKLTLRIGEAGDSFVYTKGRSLLRLKSGSAPEDGSGETSTHLLWIPRQRDWHGCRHFAAEILRPRQHELLDVNPG